MINVALIGCGFMGRMHRAVYSELKSVKLTTVFDQHGDRSSRMAEKSDLEVANSFEAILSDPEVHAVDICLPTHLHAEFSGKALRAGKHVVCEKPMALTVADAEDMIREAKLADRKLMIAQCIRFWPEYVALKEMVDGGEFGKLLSLNLTRCGPFPTWSAEGWIGKEELSGGAALDMHIHDTDFALYLLGKPDSLHSRAVFDDHGPSHIFTTMGFGETIVHGQGGWNLPPGAPFKMAFRAVFERGAAIFDSGPLTFYPQQGEPWTPDVPRMAATGVGGNISDLGGYYFELDYFYNCVKNGEDLAKANPESSAFSLEVCLREIAEARAAGGKG